MWHVQVSFGRQAVMVGLENIYINILQDGMWEALQFTNLSPSWSKFVPWLVLLVIDLLRYASGQPEVAVFTIGDEPTSNHDATDVRAPCDSVALMQIK